MENKKYYFIDLLRITAALAVIVLHVSANLSVLKQVGSSQWWLGNIFNASSRWCVPVFVMISGYLLLNPGKEQSVGPFLKRRLIRVGVPLLTWSAIYFVWDEYANGAHLTIKEILKRILSGKPYAHLYFLFVIAGLYLITPILRKFLQRASKIDVSYLIFISFGVSIAVIALNNFIPSISTSFNAFTMFLLYTCYYVLGYYIKTYISKKYSFKAYLTIFFLSLSIAIVGSYFSAVYEFNNYFFSYLSPLVILMSISLFMIFIGLENYLVKHPNLSKVTNIIADSTFGIYLVHLIVKGILEKGFLGITISVTTVNAFIGLPLTVLMVFLISLITTYVIKKIPLIKHIMG